MLFVNVVFISMVEIFLFIFFLIRMLFVILIVVFLRVMLMNIVVENFFLKRYMVVKFSMNEKVILRIVINVVFFVFWVIVEKLLVRFMQSIIIISLNCVSILIFLFGFIILSVNGLRRMLVIMWVMIGCIFVFLKVYFMFLL